MNMLEGKLEMTVYNSHGGKKETACETGQEEEVWHAYLCSHVSIYVRLKVTKKFEKSD